MKFSDSSLFGHHFGCLPPELYMLPVYLYKLNRDESLPQLGVPRNNSPPSYIAHKTIGSVLRFTVRPSEENSLEHRKI
jgi:hypothetical protein